MGTQLPGPDLVLYASDQFMRDAHEAGFDQILFNQQNTHDLARMARASETVTNLGGIALFGQAELAETPAAEVATLADHVVGQAVKRQAMLNQLQDGRPVETNSLATFSQRHLSAGKFIISLPVQPDETAIAEAFYRAAVHIPGEPSEDAWMRDKYKQLGEALGIAGALAGGAGFLVGLAAGGVVNEAGKRLNKWRQDHDLTLVPSKPPVELRLARQ